jgi:hypothetical protein
MNYIYDKNILRELGKQVAEISALPEQEEKKKLWILHNSLKSDVPVVFVHPDGAWNELLPEESLVCETPLLRKIELDLRQRLIRHMYIPDDVPCYADLNIRKVIKNTMWGIEPKRQEPKQARGAWHHEPVINKPLDWNKLSFPVVSYNETESVQNYDVICDILGDILPVKLTGITSISFHLMHWYCDYRGLENMYMDLYDEPGMVHDVMRFFTDGIKHMLKQYEEQNLLSINNDYTFHYTGGVGYTDELPGENYIPGHVRLCDLWAAAEAQEFASVSPDMHEEFVLQYERELMEPFGLNGYGCCDNLGKKLDGVMKIRNLRRVAVCPWADISDFVPRLKKNYIMSWKPQPSYLAMDDFDMEVVEQELATGLEKAKGGIIELILRDTHTCRNDPERFTKWVEIARRAIDKRMS